MMNNLLLRVIQITPFWKKSKPFSSIRFCSTEESSNETLKYVDQKIEKCINEIKLIGRVGSDVSIENRSGKPYAKFPLATDHYYKSPEIAEEYKKRTDWHTIVTYDPKFINYISNFIKKGKRIYISGRLSYHAGGNNPSGKYAIVILNEIIFLNT